MVRPVCWPASGKWLQLQPQCPGEGSARARSAWRARWAWWACSASRCRRILEEDPCPYPYPYPYRHPYHHPYRYPCPYPYRYPYRYPPPGGSSRRTSRPRGRLGCTCSSARPPTSSRCSGCPSAAPRSGRTGCPSRARAARSSSPRPSSTRRPQPCARRAVLYVHPACGRMAPACNHVHPACSRAARPAQPVPAYPAHVPPARGHTRGCSRAEEAQKRVEVM